MDWGTSPNLVNFGPEMAEKVWRGLAHPLNFSIGRHCQPYRMDVNRQQANFGTWYVVARAYSLEQQNAGRAHAALCHASAVNLVRRRPPPVYHTERPPLFTTRWAWVRTASRAGSSVTVETCSTCSFSFSYSH